MDSFFTFLLHAHFARCIASYNTLLDAPALSLPPYECAALLMGRFQSAQEKEINMSLFAGLAFGIHRGHSPQV
jgi:hypothetical protein